MKKLMLIAVMAVFSSGVFAGETKKTDVELSHKESAKTLHSSFGGFTFDLTDCNGDTWEVTVSCNYDCSPFDTNVHNALNNWYINATGCDPDDFEDDLG
jgi:hypothetical protein